MNIDYFNFFFITFFLLILLNFILVKDIENFVLLKLISRNFHSTVSHYGNCIHFKWKNEMDQQFILPIMDRCKNDNYTSIAHLPFRYIKLLFTESWIVLWLALNANLAYVLNNLIHRPTIYINLIFSSFFFCTKQNKKTY